MSKKAVLTCSTKTNFKKTDKFLNKMMRKVLEIELDRYGRMGVEALAAATPVDTGKTASSWCYKYEYTDYGIDITWYNTNTIEDGRSIAILLQYGHGKKNGGYVKGHDYINPAMKPVFESIADSLWKKVVGS